MDLQIGMVKLQKYIDGFGPALYMEISVDLPVT